MVLTSLAAMELTIPDLVSRTRLTIHIIGSTEHELLRLRLTEGFLHLLTNLRALIVGYIGPDLPAASTRPGELENSQCCLECASAGRKRQIFFRRELYHQCRNSGMSPEYSPDLIVAYHSGHADSESGAWAPTLGHILDLDTPTLFTTYNEREARDEEAVLTCMGARFLQTYGENRWRGMVPKLENFGAREYIAQQEQLHKRFMGPG
ncbi:MAG: hypothetical protein Q9207_004063 [Kuettlingeria erythrocarpa]